MGMFQRSIRNSATRRRWQGLRNTPSGLWGMALAHCGVGVFIIGVAFTSIYTVEKDLRMAPGDSFEVQGYHYRFEGVEKRTGPNYASHTGRVTVSRDGRQMASLMPEKRIYNVQRMPMTEAGIAPGLFADFYVVLGEPLGSDGSWAVRIYYKAYIRWIWLGALLMAGGGLLAACDRRYRSLGRQTALAGSADSTFVSGRS